MPDISQKANDLIIACEVSSRAYYERHYRKPELPGAASGITIGIGYDLGYAPTGKIRSDWQDRVPGHMLNMMLRCSGKTQSSARPLLSEARRIIDIPWSDAIYVYQHVDIPQWVERVCRAIPGADNLHPHCLGALTSLAYNRGASFNKADGRYREMRAIRSHIQAGQLDRVDDEIRSMKRLWPNLRGLRIRRDQEADLWNLGLRSPSIAEKPKVNENPPPLVPKPKPGKAEGGAGAAGAAGTAGAVQQATEAGWSNWEIAAVVIGGILITSAIMLTINHHRTRPVLAREKD